MSRFCGVTLLPLLVLCACAGPRPTVIHSGVTTTLPNTVVEITAPPGAPARVPPGTPVMVSVVRGIDSSVPQMANPELVISGDVIDASGRLLIAAGTPVQAGVDVIGRSRLGRPGEVHIELQRTVTPEGITVPLTGYYDFFGETRRGLMIGLTVGMILVYPPFNLLHMLHRGADVILPPGTVLSAVVGPG